MGIIFSIISGKGGVGKTTTAANLAIGTAMQGKKTVVVDFDIGQRNLDMILGLENRVVYDITHVMDGDVRLRQALIPFKKNENLYFLAASQTKDKTVLNKEKVEKVLSELKKEFEYIFIDAPAGIESGFEHAVYFADAVIVVVNPEVSSIRDSDRAIGIVDAKSKKSQEGKRVAKYLIINRINPDLVQKGEMLSSEDILDILEIDLLGKVPEDQIIIEASNTGHPVILNEKSEAGRAFKRISRRLCGEEVPFVDIESVKHSGLLKSIKKMFQ